MGHKLRIFAAVLEFPIFEKVMEEYFCKNWEKHVKNQRLSFYMVSCRLFLRNNVFTECHLRAIWLKRYLQFHLVRVVGFLEGGKSEWPTEGYVAVDGFVERVFRRQ